jgi:very-short-patch-repair endonuclease
MGFINWLKNIFCKKPVYHEVIAVKEEKKPDEKELLLKELHAIGLHPGYQLSIGSLVADFAFPKEKIIIQILQEYNNEKREKDRKKFLNLKSFGWSVYGFQIKPETSIKEMALRIKKLLNYHKK